MLLEVTFGKLYAWAIQNVRNILLDASAKFKELGKSYFLMLAGDKTILSEYCCSSLGVFLKFLIVGSLKSVPLFFTEDYFDFVCLCRAPLPDLLNSVFSV